ncbi:MAG: hypothetical protein J7L53_06830 [Deltaproteobacteria bacterium]|nr:hypothetical protein [Deltaproteobacteria bacterium]
MRHQGIFIIVLSILLISGCGSDSTTSEQANMEKALFVSYAGAKSGEELNNVMIDDLEDVVSDVVSIVEAYVLATGELPERIDLDNPPSGITVPAGMGGYITATIATFSASAHLTLNNYTLGSRSYSGTLDGDGILDISDITNIDFLSLNVGTPSLEITYTGKGFTTCTYSNWTFYKDNSDGYPDYTLNGSFSVDGNIYSFAGFIYTRTSSSSLDIAGAAGFDGASYAISGSVSYDASGIWTSGDMTIVTSSEGASISLNSTTATFYGTMGTWTKDGWREDRLAP